MYDSRIVANFMLDTAKEYDIGLTNLALQKLLFFAHSICLSERKSALVSGYFEAWKYGPVHPVVYQAFKSQGSSVIMDRAMRFDPVTRMTSELGHLEDRVAKEICTRVILHFGRLNAGRLVDLTHADGGPWHHVVKNSENGANIGLRISNEVIAEKQSRLKISITPEPISGEPYEDSPLN